jgi:hypothetical protein
MTLWFSPNPVSRPAVGTGHMSVTSSKTLFCNYIDLLLYYWAVWGSFYGLLTRISAMRCFPKPVRLLSLPPFFWNLQLLSVTNRHSGHRLRGVSSKILFRSWGYKITSGHTVGLVSESWLEVISVFLDYMFCGWFPASFTMQKPVLFYYCLFCVCLNMVLINHC